MNSQILINRKFKTTTNNNDLSKKSEKTNKKIESSSLLSSNYILIGTILFRIFNAFCVRTFFNPDEYWQSLEVAHNQVFKYGFLTWEWKEGLRSYFHPLIFAILYKVLYILNLDSSWSIIWTPKILQAIFAGISDWYLFKLSLLFFDVSISKWVLIANLLNWFTFYCVVRTFSNSLETILTIVAIYYLYFSIQEKETQKIFFGMFNYRQVGLIWAAITFLIRPTSALLWICIGATYLFFYISQWKERFYFILETAIIGIIALIVMIGVDSYFYGKFIVVPYHFILFNVIKGGGTFYGSHPWHWYFSQAFPAITATMLPFFIGGILQSKKFDLKFLFPIFWLMLILSAQGHKEFRFIFPILPLAIIYVGVCLNSIFLSKKVWLKAITWCLLLTNIPISIYLSLFHQLGRVEVMNYIQTLSERDSVHFWMPCHSTPYYSHVHKNISMLFWDCSPSWEPNYIDQADQFKFNPNQFLFEYYNWNQSLPQKPSLPTHAVLFETMLPKMKTFLNQTNFTLERKYFETFILENGNIEIKHVLVFKKNEYILKNKNNL